MTPQDRVAIAIDTLERAMDSARGALMPQFPAHNTPGERYVRAFDVLSGRIPEALITLRRALKDLEATAASEPALQDDQPRYQVRRSGFDFDVIDTHDPDPVVATYESESEAEDHMDELNRAASGAVGEEER